MDKQFMEKFKEGSVITRFVVALSFGVLGLVLALNAEAVTKKNTIRPARVVQFSKQPTDSEIFQKQLLPLPLVPMGGIASGDENHSLATALLSFSKRTKSDDDSALTGFIQDHPQSRWNAALWANLGNFYYNTGFFTKALDSWKKSWELSKKETEPHSKQIADYAVTEYLRVSLSLGQKKQAESTLAEVDSRPMTGPAAVTRTHLRSTLWAMKGEPKKSFRCGPYALRAILQAENKLNFAQNRILWTAESSGKQGFSLAEVQQLAKKTGSDYVAVQRVATASVVVHSIVHWKLNHFAAVMGSYNGKYVIRDPLMQQDILVSQAAIDSESSGYFLIPGKTPPAGYVALDKTTAGKIIGSGYTFGSDPDACKPCEQSGGGDGGGGGNGSNGGGGCTSCNGMARYSVKLMLVSLTFNDTPLWYTPAVGPSVSFATTYNQMDVNQPAIFNHSNLGNKWTFGWMSYIIDNPQDTVDGVKLYLRGGGAESYNAPDSQGNFPPQQESRATLQRTISGGSISYVRSMPDGSQEIYDLPNGSSTYPRYVYLTRIIDPQGHTVQINYDSQYYRINSITDALGQTTTLSYNVTSDSFKISSITDPFGRTASFTYDSDGHLSSITDMMGLVSQFSYSSDTDDIISLTTPYGTTNFTRGDSSTLDQWGILHYQRWIEIVNPLGQKERIESMAPASIPDTESVTPSDKMSVNNGYLNFRNVFYWDRKLTATYGTSDYTKARIYHFLHSNDSRLTSGVLESYKKPLENRVWYHYKDQGDPALLGPTALVDYVGRVLDDGTSQVTHNEYDDLGHLTKTVDALGRETDYQYAANGIDQIQVSQKTANGYDVLSSTTYNSIHQPLTITDASGQTTTYSYTVDGDLHAVTMPDGATTTYAYDPSHLHQVKTITGPLSGQVTTNTYDNFNRLKTNTDSEGYTITYDYDLFDRVTKVTYPDGTFDQETYKYLDLATETDRIGRTTQYYYNGIRQKVLTIDPLGRKTQFFWCLCGAMSRLVDPMGKVTRWTHDGQGRLTEKIYPDGTKTTYAYENTTSRLKSKTDALGQVTNYSYNIDNTSADITYSNAIHTTAGVSYVYDSYYDRQIRMVDGTGVTTYSYNSAGMLGANKVSTISGPLANSAISYTYDSRGRVVGMAIAGVNQAVSYDVGGRAITNSNALGTFSYSYVNATKRIASLSYPNGQITSYGYYGNMGDQRLQQIQNKAPDGTTILSQFNYQYNAAGEITRWTQVQGGSSTGDYGYGYDAASRLTSATLSSTVSGVANTSNYVYDDSDNRLNEQRDSLVMQASYNNLNQLVSTSGGGTIPIQGKVNKAANVSVNGKAANVNTNAIPWIFTSSVAVTPGTNNFTIIAKDGSGNATTNIWQFIATSSTTTTGTYSYDLNGNLTNDGNRTFDWDTENRLLAINYANGNRSEFTYDGQGRRVKIVEKNGSTINSTKQFLWLGKSMAEERDGNNSVTKRFFGQGEQITGTNYFYTKDHLGSIRELVDSNGNVQTKYSYDPYGRVTKLSGSVDSDFFYTGHYNHAQSELYLTLYRAYDSNAARWLSRDPSGEGAGINLYGYVRDNPLRFKDALGLDIQNEKICTIDIYAGHFQDLDPFRFKQNKLPKYCRPTERGFVGCGSSQMNHDDDSVPNMPKNDLPGDLLGGWQAGAATFGAIVSAKMEAKRLCSQSCKCDYVIISVICADQDMRDLNPWCGYVEVVRCK